LGGNLKGLENYCCVRVSHALMRAGHKITQKSDYKDADGNKYIIRVVSMKSYMTGTFGEPLKVTESSAKGKQSIICFDECGFSDATGHFDLWNGSNAAYKEYWNKTTKVYLWEF